MTERMARIQEIRRLIVEQLELDVPEQLQESDRLTDDLRLDSIMLMQLIVYLEESFGIEVPEDGVDPESFLTVGSLADFVESLSARAV